jgi:hypothetical protein
MASTDSHGYVYDAEGVAVRARFPDGGGGGGWMPLRLKILTSVRPVLAPDAFVASTRTRWALTAGKVTRL